MAPWPEQGSEPKAPDKDKREEVDVNTRVELDDSSENSKSVKSEQKSDVKELETLDDGQLKALLDEAITYKNPKDREGKSELFKELLQKAEVADIDGKGLGGTLGGKFPRSYYNLPVRRRQSRHSGQSRECGVGVSSTRGGSLQNLHALGMEGGRRSRRRDTLVSARQREGGSLPTNVNVDNDTDLDMICPNYTSRATLEVSGNSKEENATSKEEPNAPTFLKVQGHHYLPNGSETQNTKEEESRVVETVYASSISVGPVESGAMLYPSTPVQHVSVLSIPPSQIHTGADDHRISDSSEAKKLNVSRSRQHKKGHLTDETDNTSEGYLGLPLTAYWNRYSSFTLLDFQDANTRLAFGNTVDSKTKPLDENGNALACVRMDSNCIDRKKRRVKAKNDRNTILSEEIEGFRGEADIDTLMEYIESPSLDSSKSNKARTNQSNGTRNSVKVRAKEEEPRSIKRRKDKFQRCNSLEEISKTKLEDLTEESSSERVNGPSHPMAKKQVTLDDAELGKKSSWDEVVETARVNETKDRKPERVSPEPVQDSEFHVVTKKQRKKKRRAGCGSRGGSKPDYYSGREGGSGRLFYQHRRDQGTSQPRRKSASSVPPSDKSDSSDLDSVHSLPVSSSAARTRVGQNSVSGGSTPQASYADIARTAASPPDGSQINIDRQERCSANSSFTESYERTSSTNPMLPMPLASLKKDAMTDTNCDNSPMLTSEDYPPLEVRTLDLCTETVKRSRSGAGDNSATTDKVIVKTDTVIPDRESGDGPQSLPNDSMCIKSSDTSSIKRPPVILMHDPSRGDTRVPDVKFGFDVNYKLLQNDESSECECSETVDSSPPPPPVLALPLPPVAGDQGYYSLVPDQNLVQYLSATWEEVMDKLRSGKAQYYINGQ